MARRKMLAALSALAIGANAAAADDLPGPFLLGVQTHFEQGWQTQWIGRAAELGARVFRDELSWAEIEKAAGVYDFAGADAYMRPAIGLGLLPLIVVTDSNPLYDNDNTPYSPTAIQAVADYLGAALDRYEPGLARLEIGNEVNSSDFVAGPFADDKPRHLAETAQRIRQTLKPAHPDVQVLCSGVNSLSLGFLRAFFRQGGLQYCDAISVHPYREIPETLDLEIDRLNDLMREFGGQKPIYATEFGSWFKDAQDAPDYMMKMVAIMGAAGVAEAYWYALLDEPWWPNMGLLDATGQEKPAAKSFRFLQEQLLPLGRPVARSTTRTVRIFEFGEGGRGFVVWGVEGVLKVQGDATFFDATGKPAPPQTAISRKPVIVLGKGLTIEVEQAVPVADAVYQYNSAPWSYHVRRPDGRVTPLEIIDWEWTSFRGAPDLSPLGITDGWVTTARFADGPYHAIERFTAIADGDYRVDGWWQAGPDEDASAIELRHNDQVLAAGLAAAEPFTIKPVTITLRAGDTLDFDVGPGGPMGNGSVQRSIQVRGPLK